jgi:hypothetical protein
MHSAALHGEPGHNSQFMTEEDLDVYAEFYASEARESLWAYRRFMDPDLVLGLVPARHQRSGFRSSTTTWSRASVPS